MLGRPSFKKGIHLMRHCEDQPLQVLRCTCWRKPSGHEYRGLGPRCMSDECKQAIDAGASGLQTLSFHSYPKDLPCSLVCGWG